MLDYCLATALGLLGVYDGRNAGRVFDYDSINHEREQSNSTHFLVLAGDCSPRNCHADNRQKEP